MGEDIADLAERDDIAPGRRQAIEQGRFRRRDGEIAAIGGARESRAIGASERPRDDAADLERQGQFARDAADLEQAIETESFLMRGDLQHRIGRGIDDRLAGRHMLFAKFDDDLGAGCMLVAEEARQDRSAR